MPDELPEGHIQMADKWSSMGAPEGTTPRRRSRATTTPVAEPEESTEAEEEEEEDEDEDEGGDTEC